eukprot:scaffold3437_cov145-Skeletonema_menzelii.AAC.23
MMSSTKKFILAASMLAASEATGLLRGNLDERESRASDCFRRRWHFTLSESSDSMQCSNDMNYPSVWDNEEFYDAVKANGRSCEVIDECAVEEEEVSDIEVQTDPDRQQCGQKWHMNLEKTWGCSNSKDFPDDWWFAGNVEQMLHDTPESCCNEIFGSPDCEITDECATDMDNLCTAPVWHYDSANHFCTNHGNYPIMWELEEERFLYQTHEECCEKNASWLQGCNVHDFCSEWNEVAVDRD